MMPQSEEPSGHALKHTSLTVESIETVAHRRHNDYTDRRYIQGLHENVKKYPPRPNIAATNSCLHNRQACLLQVVLMH